MIYDSESMSSLLVQSIGIPGLCDPDISQLNLESVSDFFETAKQNKISLLFLRTVSSVVDGAPFQSTLSDYEDQYKRTLDLAKFVGALLNGIETRYTFFKTMKPFPYTPSDVDVLLLSNNDLEKVIRTLKDENCVVLNRDNYGATLFSLTHKICIDLTTQVAVSGLIYMNKKVLFEHVVGLDVSGTNVKSLDPQAELLTAIAHSVFKEQIYTLNDYYTIVMLTQYWKDATKLAKELHLKHALETVLNITLTITVNTFGPSNPLTKHFEKMGITSSTVLDDKAVELPKKYPLAPLIVEFLKKLAIDQLTSSSLSSAVLSFCNLDFYRRLLNHATREKY